MFAIENHMRSFSCLVLFENHFTIYNLVPICIHSYFLFLKIKNSKKFYIKSRESCIKLWT